MADASANITATLTVSDKSLTFDQRLAENEVRPITIDISSLDFPSGTYSLQMMYDWQVVAECDLTVSGGDLIGTLDLSDTALQSLFDVKLTERINVNVLIWSDGESTDMLWAADRVDIWRNRYSS